MNELEKQCDNLSGVFYPKSNVEAERIQVDQVKDHPRGKYTNGFKYCKICEVYVKTTNIWCECGKKYRTKAQRAKYKKLVYID